MNFVFNITYLILSLCSFNFYLGLGLATSLQNSWKVNTWLSPVSGSSFQYIPGSAIALVLCCSVWRHHGFLILEGEEYGTG